MSVNDYILTPKELEEWKENPYINPKTKYRINPKSKKGIAQHFQKQLQIYEGFLKIQNITCNIPDDVSMKIYEILLRENLQKVESKVRLIWETRKNDILRHHDFISTRGNEDQFTIISQTENLIHKIKDNGFEIFKNSKDHDFLMLTKGLYIKVLNFDDIDKKETLILFKYYDFDSEFSSIFKDDQYTIKYNISRDFWRNILPYVHFQVIYNHDNQSLKMNCVLDIKNEDQLIQKISLQELQQDMYENENHPILRAYREGFRIFVACIPKIISILDVDDYKNGCNKQQMIYTVFKELYTKFNIEKDISLWNISFDHVSSYLQKKYTNLIGLKFGNNHSLHKKRIKTLLCVNERKKII